MGSYCTSKECQYYVQEELRGHNTAIFFKFYLNFFVRLCARFYFYAMSSTNNNGYFEIEYFVAEMPGKILVKWEGWKVPTWEPKRK